MISCATVVARSVCRDFTFSLVDVRNRCISGMTMIARMVTAISSSTREKPAFLFSFDWFSFFKPLFPFLFCRLGSIRSLQIRKILLTVNLDGSKNIVCSKQYR